MRTKQEEIKRLRRLKIENIALFIVSVIVAFFLLNSADINKMVTNVGAYVYLLVFVICFFYNYGFLTVPSVVLIYLISKRIDPLSIALIGSVSATLTNVLIFSFVKFSLVTETYLRAKEIGLKIKKMKSRAWFFLIPALSGFIITSPFSDEFNASLFESVEYNLNKMLISSYVFNLTFLYIIAYFSSII